MRVIITGGSGLIGRALVQTLQSRPNPYEIVILSRNPKRVKGFPEDVKIEQWDAKTAEGWGPLADGAYAIINLAGESIGDGRWTAAKRESVINSRVNAGQAVVDAINQASQKPKVLLQASAVGYYGDRGDEVLTETSKTGQGFLPEVCQAWEESVKSVADQVRLVYLRTGVVLSTKEGALAKLMLPMNFFAGGPLGNGKQWFPWIHIDDEVEILAHLLEDDAASGVFNLVAPNVEQNKTFVQKLGKVMGRPSFAPAPAFALKLVLGDMSALVLDSQRVKSTRLTEVGYDFKYADTLRALKDIVYNKK